jgi:hypothetical protein
MRTQNDVLKGAGARLTTAYLYVFVCSVSTSGKQIRYIPYINTLVLTDFSESNGARAPTTRFFDAYYVPMYGVRVVYEGIYLKKIYRYSAAKSYLRWIDAVFVLFWPFWSLRYEGGIHALLSTQRAWNTDPKPTEAFQVPAEPRSFEGNVITKLGGQEGSHAWSPRGFNRLSM